ncbi:MAG: GNAT family N-acetyltransferase [Lachnospiraceae bacterium]|nr:GNAT family N-acetyltransferase [Lachnospiraceae bacterium]
MQTERIVRENQSRYLKLLSNDELFANEEGRYSCFGAFDEDSREALGVLVAQILPAYIRIVKLYTLPKHRNRGVASTLLKLATDLPEELSLPFYAVVSGEEADPEFLTKRGFVKTDDRYSYLSGWLEDLEDLPRPQNLPSSARVLPADRVPYESLSDYVLSFGHDELLQFPEMKLDMNRFSDGSLVCTRDKEINAVLLMEELDEYIQISWIHCRDSRSLYQIFSVMKKALKSEYDPEAELRFLLCDNKGEEAIEKVFRYRERIPVHIYRLEKEVNHAGE